MYKQEAILPYKSDGDKGEQVEEMFDHIAPTYDKLNHRMSWNIDRRWRKQAVSRLVEYHPQTILDVASGTGDFALLMAQELKPRQIVATDISEAMMRVGNNKMLELSLQDVVQFQRADCMALPFQDESFDAVTATFGIRNFPDLEQGLREMCRVMRSGGRLCVLELSSPKNPMMRSLFKVYSHTVLPLWGRCVAKDAKAYHYLRKTIEGFPCVEEMVPILKAAGFRQIEAKRLTFGVCTLYTATK